MSQAIGTTTAVGAVSSAPAAAGEARSSLVPVALTLWRREVVRFLRQRSRVTGALLTPVVFWLLLGSGLNEAFVADPGEPRAAGGVGYLEYFFPGTVTMILLFTAIFSTISVIEDRREGFLQGVLVSPAPRLAIVLGKVLGGATLATGQAALFLLLWPLVGTFPGVQATVLALAAMFAMGCGLTALGLCFAWRMESTAGFHAIMNLVLMPMWFLCGAVFPVATAPVWLRVVMYANPLTYGQATLAGLLTGEPAVGLGLPLAATAAMAAAACVAAVAAATWVVARPTTR